MFASNLTSLLPLAALALAFALRGGRESFAFAAVFPLLAASLFLPRIRTTLRSRVTLALPFAALLVWCLVALISGPPVARDLYRLSQLFAYLVMIVVASAWTFAERRNLMLTVIALGAIDATVFLLRRMGDPQATGVLIGNPSYSGLLCAAGFLAALALTRDTSNRNRAFGAIFGLLFGAAILLLRSRSALIGLVAGLWFVLPRKRFLSITCVLALAIIAAALVDRERALAYLKVDLTQPHEWLGRITIWRTACASLWDKPLFGWGLGNFETAYLRHQLPMNDILKFDRSSPFAHNDYLQIAIEAGLPALTIFLWGLIRFFRAPGARNDASDQWAKATVMLFAVAALFNFTVFLPLCGLIASAAIGFRMSTENDPAANAQEWASAAVAALFSVSFTVFLTLNAVADHLVSRGRAADSAHIMPIRADLWYAFAMESIEHRDWVGKKEREGEIFDALNRAAKASPEDAFVWNRIGVFAMSVMKPPINPRGAFERALSLAPSHAPFWIDAGFERLESGDAADARRHFERAAELEPNASMPKFALAMTAATEGDAVLANRLSNEAVALHCAYADRVAQSGYATYLFGLDEEQIRLRVQRLLQASNAARHSPSH